MSQISTCDFLHPQTFVSIGLADRCSSTQSNSHSRLQSPLDIMESNRDLNLTLEERNIDVQKHPFF
jgi:hypothetical protein